MNLDEPENEENIEIDHLNEKDYYSMKYLLFAKISKKNANDNIIFSVYSIRKIDTHFLF